MKGGGPDKATRVPDGVRRATSASTPSRSTQASARHRERVEPTSSSSPRLPAFSHRSLSPSPSSPGSPSSAGTSPVSPASPFLSTVPAIHRHLLTVPSAAVAALSSYHLLAPVAAPSPVSSSSLRQPPSLSSPAPPPSVNCHPLPCFLSLSSPSQPPSSPPSSSSSSSSSPSSTNRHRSPSRRHRRQPRLSHRPLPCVSLAELHPGDFLRLAPSIAPAIYRRSPPPPPFSPLGC